MSNPTFHKAKKNLFALATPASYHHDGQRETCSESFHDSFENIDHLRRARDPRRAFLDRFALVFACSQANKPRHVSASVLVQMADGPRVIIAKNQGCDKKDKHLASRLQNWLRGVTNGSTASREGYSIWYDLVDHNKDIIKCYIRRGQNSNLMTELSLTSPSLKLASNQAFLFNYENNWFRDDYTRFILKAHELRQPLSGRKEDAEFDECRQTINLLGSYRAAYLEFEKFAKNNPDFGRLEIVCLPNQPECPKYCGNEIRSAIQKIARNDKLEAIWQAREAKLTVLQKVAEGAKQLPAHQHAEIQLVNYINKRHTNFNEIYKYVGCSRRACFLCYNMLGALEYSTQGCHSILFERWDAGELYDSSARVRKRLKETERYLIEDLKRQLADGSSYPAQHQRQVLPYLSPPNSPRIGENEQPGIDQHLYNGINSKAAVRLNGRTAPRGQCRRWPRQTRSHRTVGLQPEYSLNLF